MQTSVGCFASFVCEMCNTLHSSAFDQLLFKRDSDNDDSFQNDNGLICV